MSHSDGFGVYFNDEELQLALLRSLISSERINREVSADLAKDLMPFILAYGAARAERSERIFEMAADDLVRDAARYRELRKVGGITWTCNESSLRITEGDYDLAVDKYFNINEEESGEDDE